MKRQTVRFYTDSGLYKGWCHLNKVNFTLEVKPWLRSGNFVMVKLPDYDHKVNWINLNLFYLNTSLYEAIKE